VRLVHSLRGLIPLPDDRVPDARDEGWRVYYGDLHVGTISIRWALRMLRSGLPTHHPLKGPEAGRSCLRKCRLRLS
jgi:hypothetical protein